MVLEKIWDSLGSREIKPVNLKGNQPWVLIGRTDAAAPVSVTGCKQPTLWKSLWCWERLRVEGEEGVRGWEGWMASLMNFSKLWETVRDRQASMLSMGSQRVKHDGITEQQQKNSNWTRELFLFPQLSQLSVSGQQNGMKVIISPRKTGRSDGKM